MKFSMSNKHLNVSNNYLNHIEKTVTTFICRNKECFEFPSPQKDSKLYVTVPEFPDARHKNKCFRLKELL